MNAIARGFFHGGLLACFCACGTDPVASDFYPLWEPLSRSTQPEGRAMEHWALDQQPISFREPVLFMLNDTTRPLPMSFSMALSDKHKRDVDIISRKTGPSLSTVVEGKVRGTPPGDILLAIKGEAVAGTVRIGKRTWKIEYTGNGRHRLVEVDPEKLPPD
jgi:hypothetical protein